MINSADGARKAVRQRYKDGADLIKVTGTGGVLSLAKSGMNPQLTEEEFVAIVTTAHDYGMKVAVHAHGDEGMRRAETRALHQSDDPVHEQFAFLETPQVFQEMSAELHVLITRAAANVAGDETIWCRPQRMRRRQRLGFHDIEVSATQLA